MTSSDPINRVNSDKINILISNDDGVAAPGINILAAEVAQNHQVTVVAPHKNRSASSSALTLDRPLRVEQLNNGFYSVTGTPVDCVHLGSHQLMAQKPDMVISGINRGANLGDDVMYSGTVAAAMEGRNMGFPSVAISLASSDCEHYQTAAAVMANILKRFSKANFASNIILNVNVPDLPLAELKGYRITRLGCRHRADTIVPAKDPKGNDVYWIGPPSDPQDVGDGTDFNAIANGFVSITPLTIDFTAYQQVTAVNQWLKNL